MSRTRNGSFVFVAVTATVAIAVGTAAVYWLSNRGTENEPEDSPEDENATNLLEDSASETIVVQSRGLALVDVEELEQEPEERVLEQEQEQEEPVLEQEQEQEELGGNDENDDNEEDNEEVAIQNEAIVYRNVEEQDVQDFESSNGEESEVSTQHLTTIISPVKARVLISGDIPRGMIQLDKPNLETASVATAETSTTTEDDEIFSMPPTRSAAPPRRQVFGKRVSATYLG